MRFSIALLFITISVFVFPTLGQPTNDGQRVAKSSRCDFDNFVAVPVEHFSDDAVLKKVLPRYPKVALKEKTEGRVTVKILVNRKGFVERACAISGDTVFFRSAEMAARRWRFKANYGLAFATGTIHRTKKIYATTMIQFTYILPS